MCPVIAMLRYVYGQGVQHVTVFAKLSSAPSKTTKDCTVPNLKTTLTIIDVFDSELEEGNTFGSNVGFKFNIFRFDLSKGCILSYHKTFDTPSLCLAD